MSDIKIVVADDENSVVITLKKLIESMFKDVRIFGAKDGLEAWAYLQDENPDIILSDISMPGMNGIDLLKRIRANPEYERVYYMVMTAAREQKLRMKAMEEGADDFIGKPFSVEDIAPKLRSAIRVSKLISEKTEENELLHRLTAALENELADMTELIVDFLQARIPSAKDLLKRVADASTWIAEKIEKFDGDEIQDIEIASYLAYAGKISLPDNLIDKPVMIDGKVSEELLRQVPITARKIIGRVARFKEVARILYSIYENLDGSGFPDKKQSWQIPLASRIIRVALDYEEKRRRTDIGSKAAINELNKEVNRLYDQRAVALLDQYLGEVASKGEDASEKPISLSNMEEGMILSRPITTTSGMKLLPAGAVLRSDTIRKIISHCGRDPVLGNVYVKKQS